MRLCFGTFAQVLRLCKREGVADYELVGAMTRTIDPDCQYANPDNKTSVSRLFSCTGNISDGRKRSGSGAFIVSGESISKVSLLAPSADKDEVAYKFASKVITLLDEDKKTQAVLALLDIIRNDDDLDTNKKQSFEKYMRAKRNTLLSQSNFVLADFLAGLFLYTVIAVKNTVGKGSVATITAEYIASFNDHTWLIDVTDKLIGKRDEFSASRNNEVDPIYGKAQAEESEVSSQITIPDFSAYLHSAEIKYSMIKTLLYNDQPKLFYDFYVCNDVWRRVSIPGKSNKYQFVTIRDATIKSLSEHSRFIIIAGAGGLGKSMMMRHLLLNSISEYEILKLVPVFIPLKDFDESSSGLLEYAFSKFETLCGNVSIGEFEETLVRGSCLLLFDGLDEIGSVHASRFERELEVFTDKYPSNRFIISSRPYQNFISYTRFSVLQLRPFRLDQATRLIDNLEFRLDDPSIKAKFKNELSSTLWRTHAAFTENPLLLTIMLMTFERFAEVPSKMHIFYREAFMALSITHDASKGAYKRALRTGLSVDTFADYFAEICFRSYREERFELTEGEFTEYFNELSMNDGKVKPTDFLHDLCSNMCLMYNESGRYHFTHRSFQEYFCALFFSRQKDKFIRKLGDFFEKRHRRTYGDQTFGMLCDLIPEKVEEFVFIPFLEELFRTCDEDDGYWTFLETIYPCFAYQKGEVPDSTYNMPVSFIYSYLKKEFDPRGNERYREDDLPDCNDLLSEEYVYVDDENGDPELTSKSELSSDYRREYGEPDVVGWRYEVDIGEVRSSADDYNLLIRYLDDDEFIFKIEYQRAREYLGRLKAKQKTSDDSLLDLL